MTVRLITGMRALRFVAERIDPTAEVGTGVIADALGITLSSASRLCSDLEAVGFFERGRAYGSYRLGGRAIRLSGRAASPLAATVRYALTIAAQATGETACLAAGTAGEAHIISAVGSEWTLHAAADVGDSVPAGSAMARVLETSASGRAERGQERVQESTVGRVVEIASPVLDLSGERLAAIAVRLPVNRSSRGIPRARRAVEAARRDIEAALSTSDGRPVAQPRTPEPSAATAFEAASLILEHLSTGPDTASGVARGTGLRPDRVQRLLASCVQARVVLSGTTTSTYELCWGVHGWHRATTPAALVARGRPLVAAAAAETGTFGFITVLKGIRSFTVVEELGSADGGITMMPWLGRPHPIIGSDGGPSLIAGLSPEFLVPLLRRKHSEHELETLQAQTRIVAREGVLSIESIEEAGLISTSAPIYDASGTVAGAACLTGGTDSVKSRMREIKHVTRRLARDITATLS